MTLLPEAIEYHIAHLPTVTLMSIITFLILGICSWIAKRYWQMVPQGLQNLVEWALGFIYDLADEIIGPTAAAYYPLLVGLFLFIFTGNILGLIPGFISPTANLNTTVALALIVFFYYHYQGVKTQGWHYFKHFAGPVWWLAPLMIPIGIISHLARPLSLAFRLFGNILAKEIILTILAMLISIFLLSSGFLQKSLALLPLILRPAIIILGTLVSLIQAGVFLILTTIYIAGAVRMEEH